MRKRTVALSLVGAGIFAIIVLRVASPSEDSVRAMIQQELPLGSSPNAVVAYCNKNGWSNSGLVMYEQYRQINASIPTYRNWPMEGGVYVVFTFSGAGSLQRFKVDEAYDFL